MFVHGTVVGDDVSDPLWICCWRRHIRRSNHDLLWESSPIPAIPWFGAGGYQWGKTLIRLVSMQRNKRTTYSDRRDRERCHFRDRQRVHHNRSRTVLQLDILIEESLTDSSVIRPRTLVVCHHRSTGHVVAHHRQLIEWMFMNEWWWEYGGLR